MADLAALSVFLDGVYFEAGLVKLILQDKRAHKVLLFKLVLFSVTIFFTILKVLSEEALLCGMQSNAFISLAS